MSMRLSPFTQTRSSLARSFRWVGGAGAPHTCSAVRALRWGRTYSRVHLSV